MAMHDSLKKRKEAIKKTSMTAEEKERVNNIMDLQREMLDVREDQVDRWDDNIRRQQFEKTVESDLAVSRDGRSNIRIPMEFAYVESKTADEMETLPFPKVLPVEPSDVEAAKEFQKALDFVLYNILNINEKLFKMNIQKNTFGDAILKVYWHKEDRVIKRPIVKKNKNGVRDIKFKKQKIRFYNDIKVDLVDIRQFLIDPIVFQFGKTLDDANYCQFLSVYRIDEFKQIFENRGGFKNLDMVGTSRRLVSESARSQSEENADLRDKLVEVYEHWDVLNDELIIIANDIEIRHTPIPYFNPLTGKKSLPLAHFVGHLQVTGFYNVGEIDIIKDLIEERQTQRNINIDAAKAYTHPFLVVGGTNDIDVDGFTWGINSVMELDDINQFKQITLGGNSGLPFNLEAANQQDAIVVTGNDVTGIIPQPGQTATETIEKKEAAVKRTRMTNTYNELNGYRRFYNLVKDMILQFYGSEEVDKLTKPGKKGKGKKIVFRGKTPEGEPTFFEIDRKTLNKDYDIDIVANNQIPASREINKLRNQETLQTIASLPFNPETGELPEFLKPAVRKVMQTNLELTTEEINKVIGPEKEEPQRGSLSDILQEAANEGLAIEGVRPVAPEGGEAALTAALSEIEGEGGGPFTRGGTPPKAKATGVNANAEALNVTQ